MSRLLNNQPRRISIYRLQRRPSFGFESSVSSTPMTSGDPVVTRDASTPITWGIPIWKSTNIYFARGSGCKYCDEYACV